jgi:hypothetical protein
LPNVPGSPQAVQSADSGFRPDVNGFSFRNYGDEIPTVGLTPAEMQRMFGESVIASKAGADLIIKHPAKRWMTEANKAMANGHCEGMAVLSELIYYKKVNPQTLGGSKAAELSLRDERVQKEIAYWWTTQVTSPGGVRKVHDSPNAVLDALMDAHRNGRNATEWWVLGIFKPDGTGGHTISPIAAMDFGNGTGRIEVYDNNFPSDIRAIEIDRVNNSWKYHASVNPSEISELYTGNASTQNLEAVSISARLGLQRCDFCDSLPGGMGTTPVEEYLQIWQDGEANLLISDETGRRIGYLETGEFINEIPGAEVKYFKFAEKKKTPLYILPAIGTFTIAINGLWLTEESFMGVMMIGPGSELGVQRIPVGPGSRDYVDVIKVGEMYRLKYRSNHDGSPEFILGADSEEGGYEFSVSGVKVEEDGSISANLDMKGGQFSLDAGDKTDPAGFQVAMSRIDQNGEQLFSGSSSAVEANGGIIMDFGSWQGDGSMPVQIINRNDGTITDDRMTNNHEFGYSSANPTIENALNPSGGLGEPSGLSGNTQPPSGQPGAGTYPDNGGIQGSILLPRLSGQDEITWNPES